MDQLYLHVRFPFLEPIDEYLSDGIYHGEQLRDYLDDLSFQQFCYRK